MHEKIWPRLKRDTGSAENAQSLKKLEAGEIPYSLSPYNLTQNVKLSVRRTEYRGAFMGRIKTWTANLRSGYVITGL